MMDETSRIDTKSQFDIVQDQDTALISLAQELDTHTSQLRTAVLDTVKHMRLKITSQASDMIDNERGRSRDQERRLLNQIEHLQRLMDQRTDELVSARTMNERLLTMVYAQKARKRTMWLYSEGFRRWRILCQEKKRRMKLCEILSRNREERESRHVLTNWRIEALHQKYTKIIDSKDGSHRRQVAQLETEHAQSENIMKLEMLSMKDSLAKEEERRQILEERLKSAFMRGVCQLNMEAMQVLRSTPGADDVSVASLLQAMNLTTSSVDSGAGAEPPSTDRLLRQQEALQQQLAELHQFGQLQQGAGSVAATAAQLEGGYSGRGPLNRQVYFGDASSGALYSPSATEVRGGRGGQTGGNCSPKVSINPAHPLMSQQQQRQVAAANRPSSAQGRKPVGKKVSPMY